MFAGIISGRNRIRRHLRSLLSLHAPRSTLHALLRLLILVFVGLAILDVFVAARRDLWRTYSPDEYAERVRSCRQMRPDLLVVGGSPVTEGIDPEPLRGMNWDGQLIEQVFAMGLYGATASEFWHAIEHGAVQPPKVLIYGISASDVNDSRNEPHGPASLMTWHDVREWRRLRPESGEWVTRHYLESRLGNLWQLYRYRYAIRNWTADAAESVFPGTAPELAAEARRNRSYAEQLRHGNGYTPNPLMVERCYADFKAQGLVETFKFFGNYRIGSHLIYVQRMLDWASANHVAVVFVDMPVTADLENRYPDIYREYRAWLAKMERERGVRVLRANRSVVGLDDRDFADLIHLNGNGARKLSHWLRQELEGSP